MKKLLAIALSLVLAAAMLGVVANAEPTNYSTQQWSADMFPGAIEILDDGTAEYTNILNTWYGPTIEIFNDLVTMLGDKDKLDVTFAFEIMARFKEGYEQSDTDISPLLRLVKPDALSFDQWNRDYHASLNGADPLYNTYNGNIMIGVGDGHLSCNDTEWTAYEATMTLDRANLNPDFIKNLVLTFDQIEHGILEAILVKNFGLYLTEEYRAVHPTPTPTPEPTATPEPTPKDPNVAENYSTHQWSADLFPGKINILPDGTAEYTRVRDTWYGPNIEILDDLRRMLGDKEKIDVTIVYDIKVRFKEGDEDNWTDMGPLLRIYRPSDGRSFNEWEKAYKAALNGADPVYDGYNEMIMCGIGDARIDCSDSEWTRYEATITLNRTNLDPQFFNRIVFTFAEIYGYSIIDAILVKNFGLYLTEDYNAHRPTPSPTPVPTATPAATPTPISTATPVSTATNEPADPAKKGCGSVLALGLLAMLIPAVIVVRKREQ